MEMFSAYVRTSFENDSVARLRDDHSGTTAALTDVQLRELVCVGIDRAARHGVRTVSGVRRWLNLMMHLGAEFDEDPCLGAVQAALANDALSVDMRLDEAEAVAAELNRTSESTI
jgi:hypothetical protein